MTDDQDGKAFCNDVLMWAARKIKDRGVSGRVFISQGLAFIAGALVSAVGTKAAGEALHQFADEVASGAFDRATGGGDQRN